MIQLLPHAKRLCSVIGVIWLAALILRLKGYAVSAAWLFGLGACGTVALAVLLILHHRRDRLEAKK